MRKLLTSWFGLGLLPVAPGTWGSVFPTVVFMAAGILWNSMAAIVAMAVLLAAGSVITVVCSPKVIGLTGRKDPGQIVSDEVAGQALTLLLVQLATPGMDFCITSAVGFGLFRLLDILKPFPCKKLENLPAGLGIVADDLAAGLWAAGIWIGGIYLGQHTGPSEDAAAGLTTGFAILLGTIQGLTEFLPVSSEGHLVLFQHFLPGMDAEAPSMLLLDLCLHLGTVLSIFVVFWKTIVRFTVSLLAALKSGLNPVQMYQKKAPVRLAVLGFVASAATVVFYIIFKDYLESNRSMLGLGVWWLVSAGFLYWADKRKGSIGLKRFGIPAAGLIGLSQGLAILPSVSRSGATISTAMLLGIKPRWAVEFSFLISIPAILGGAGLKLLKEFDIIRNGDLPLMPILAGIVAAFIVGVASLKILIRMSRKRNLKVFGFYCLVIAIVVFISLI